MKLHTTLWLTIVILGGCNFIFPNKPKKQQADPTAKTYCNPIDLNYRFNIDPPNVSMREAADPSTIRYKGKYYLFASKSGGYWSSDDMAQWKYISAQGFSTEDYAPAVVNIHDTLFFAASSGGVRPLYYTTTPETGEWHQATHDFPFPVWDPGFLKDDDGKEYLYWGCSNSRPLYVVELDTLSHMPKEDPTPLFGSDQYNHGWENMGNNNEQGPDSACWVEGAWMTKHNHCYYLQYAAPGTLFDTYADGVYTACSPKGPFEYAFYSPFSRKMGGFINGAGHSTTFDDQYHNQWHMTTMVISKKHIFERRLGMFPSGFDKDDVLFCNTYFGDYPHFIPNKKVDFTKEETFTGWMLQNYHSKCNASSQKEDCPARNAFNEDIQTEWVATENAPQWLMCDVDSKSVIRAFQVNFADVETQLHNRVQNKGYRFQIETSDDGTTWEKIYEQKGVRNNPHNYIVLDNPISARHIKLTVLEIPDGKVAVSGFRAFGDFDGKTPEAVQNFNISHPTDDTRTVALSWTPQSNADGYVVQYGIAPDKLYTSAMVYNDHQLTINALNRGESYYFAIKAFNKSGVSTSTQPIKLKKQND